MIRKIKRATSAFLNELLKKEHEISPYMEVTYPYKCFTCKDDGSNCEECGNSNLEKPLNKVSQEQIDVFHSAARAQENFRNGIPKFEVIHHVSGRLTIWFDRKEWHDYNAAEVALYKKILPILEKYSYQQLTDRTVDCIMYDIALMLSMLIIQHEIYIFNDLFEIKPQ